MEVDFMRTAWGNAGIRARARIVRLEFDAH